MTWYQKHAVTNPNDLPRSCRLMHEVLSQAVQPRCLCIDHERQLQVLELRSYREIALREKRQWGERHCNQPPRCDILEFLQPDGGKTQRLCLHSLLAAAYHAPCERTLEAVCGTEFILSLRFSDSGSYLHCRGRDFEIALPILVRSAALPQRHNVFWVSGPSGCGKTTTSSLFFRNSGYRVHLLHIQELLHDNMRLSERCAQDDGKGHSVWIVEGIDAQVAPAERSQLHEALQVMSQTKNRRCCLVLESTVAEPSSMPAWLLCPSARSCHQAKKRRKRTGSGDAELAAQAIRVHSCGEDDVKIALRRVMYRETRAGLSWIRLGVDRLQSILKLSDLRQSITALQVEQSYLQWTQSRGAAACGNTGTREEEGGARRRELKAAGEHMDWLETGPELRAWCDAHYRLPRGFGEAIQLSAWRGVAPGKRRELCFAKRASGRPFETIALSQFTG